MVILFFPVHSHLTFGHFIVTVLTPIREDVKDQVCGCGCVRLHNGYMSAADESKRSKFSTFDPSSVTEVMLIMQLSTAPQLCECVDSCVSWTVGLSVSTSPGF